VNPLRRILAHGAGRRARVAAAVALGAGAAGAAIGLAAVSAFLITRASEQPPVLHLMVAIVSVRFFGIARGVLRYLERLVAHDTAFRILGSLRVRTVERLAALVPGQRRWASGDVLARVVDDVDGLADLWVRVVVPGLVALVAGTGSVVLVGVLLPEAGAVLALSLVVAGVLAPIAATWVGRAAQRRIAPARGRYQAEVVDLLDGAAELAVYGALDDRLAGLDRLDRRLADAEARTAVGAGLGAVVTTLAAGTAVLLTLVLGAVAVADGRLDGVVLAVIVLTPLAAHELFVSLAPAAERLPGLAAAAARVTEMFDESDAVTEPTSPVPLPVGPYRLRLRQVAADWGGEAVLRSVDLDLAPGERVAVLGESGAGKSTLAAVLLRFLDPRAGTIELIGSDGTASLTELRGDDVRRVVGWCAQDAHVFDSTIAANLRLARPEATDDELLAALDRVGLGAFVRQLPSGLATMVGEHGRHLSGGQRQRLSLARVLLADRSIVIFDEPTEHLDDAAAAALLEELLAAAGDRSVLLVTHRPALATGVDRVVRLCDGRLEDVPDRGVSAGRWCA
jgi:thiol reductant ABC exporter CydC subunit